MTYRPPNSFIELEYILRKAQEFGKAQTLDSFTFTYGNKEGSIRWKEYCEKQSNTNTFDYKKEKYGFSEQDFLDFNKSRSVTLELCVKRHGQELGLIKWNKYCEKQRYTNSEEYLGTEKYIKVNSEKGQTLENYIRIYGELGHKKFTDYLKKISKHFIKRTRENYISTYGELGDLKFDDYIKNINRKGYSKISQELFNEIITWGLFNNTKCYYATYNKEYGVYSEKYKRGFFYDFVCSTYKLVIEFQGDHYHGNPLIYGPNDFLKGRGQGKRTAKDVWELDEIKKNVIYNERGYDTIAIWESDYNTNKTDLYKRLQNEITKHIKLHN